MVCLLTPGDILFFRAVWGLLFVCVFVCFVFVLFHINADSDCLQPNKPTNAQTLVLQVVVSAVALEVVASVLKLPFMIEV